MYNYYLKLVDYLRYREAVRKADKAHQQTGERYYVMPAVNNKNRKPGLIIMDRQNFRRLRLKHYINQKATVRDLVNESFYLTPYRDGTGFLDDKGRTIKLKQYFAYCKAQRERK